MIAYILLSYFIMLWWFCYKLFSVNCAGDAKTLFKFWILSPLSLPFVIIVNFISW